MEEDLPRIWHASPISRKIKFSNNGYLDMIFEAIRTDKANALEAWQILFDYNFRDIENEEGHEIVRIVVAKGIIELCALEMRRKPRRLPLFASAVQNITYICLRIEFTYQRILSAGIHSMAIEALNDPTVPIEIRGSLALVLTNLANYPGACSILRNEGLLEAMQPYLCELSSMYNPVYCLAICAASIYCRLLGNLETAESFQVQPVISALTKLLSHAILGDYRQVVWDIANLTRNFVELAKADINKVKLCEAIPVLVRTLHVKGSYNELVANDIVQIFLQLSFNEHCAQILESHRATIVWHLKTYPPKKYRDEMASYNNLLHFFKAIGPEDENISTAEKSSSNGPSFQDYVMISYNRGSQCVVDALDTALFAKGYSVWIDKRNISNTGNLTVVASKAKLVIICCSLSYKESPNCRREFQAIKAANIPLRFVLVEESYDVNGWLATEVADQHMIPCWDANLLDQNLSTIVNI